ncbi:DUF1836 domain-containing protein [Clostridium sp. KNHs214]|uniref:DUF1836 domain-containing protein n=1 Tax=Clostridium sp. KNHs214 TaxID=1540257 RepID=UPI00054F09E9|nr:DUF1836 domain-containing protein [Clostridium sp. KNHs214]
MEEKKVFSIKSINQLARDVSTNNIVPYDDLPQYDLFLSQVIDYLNDRFENEKYTKNIVQNYIKSEIISKPEDGKKRGYTKLHLAQLVLLSYMRPILTTDEISKVFRLAFNQINDRSDDIISWEKAYKIFSKIQEESFSDFLAKDYFKEEEFNEIISGLNLKNTDEERILVFLVVMTLIAQASAIKKLVQKIVDEYKEEQSEN